MKITGIIAEYNPFHNGHKYQLQKAKEVSNAVVVIMSGSFVQRGEVAITDKWTRAKMALMGGADLVIELPVIYSLNTAQKFAYGAVEILDKTKVINKLCFGSECGDIDELKKAAKLLVSEPPQISAKIKEYVSEGMSFPLARERAFEGHINSDILSNPNNILAVEYIKALYEQKSNIEPFTIKRYGTGYNDKETFKNIASASAIRNMVTKGEDVKSYMPYPDFDVYYPFLLDGAVIANLRIMGTQKIAQINDVGEGLENRIKEAAMQAVSVDELCDMVKTKRYPMSKIKRIVYSSLLGITNEIAQKTPDYIRVLGMNNTGKEILRDIKDKSDLNIITKVADYKGDSIVFKKDILSTDIFSICGGKRAGQDYITSPVVV